MRALLVLAMACSQPSPPPSKSPAIDDPPDEVAPPAVVEPAPAFAWQRERDRYVPFELPIDSPCRVPSPDNPTDCPRPPAKIAGQIIGKEARGGAVVITIDRGRRDHVARGWTATVLDDRDRAITPAAPITRVDGNTSYAEVAATADLIASNRHVVLERP